MDKMNIYISGIGEFSPKEIGAMANEIYCLIGGNLLSIDGQSTENIKVNCRKCESENIQKYGKTSKGQQRYRCKDCGVLFSSIFSTVIFRSQKSADTWKQFIICTLENRSLNYCAEKCNITVSTAFLFRIKILKTLAADLAEKHPNIKVKVDQRVLPTSYKGNHTLNKNFCLGREARCRGPRKAPYIENEEQRKLRQFLSSFNGVATRYVELYAALFYWLKLHQISSSVSSC